MGASGADPGEESLYYYLRSQVRFEELSEPMARAVECVLESLNSSGWLDEPDADLAAHAGVDGDTVAGRWRWYRGWSQRGWRPGPCPNASLCSWSAGENGVCP